MEKLFDSFPLELKKKAKLNSNNRYTSKRRKPSNNKVLEKSNVTYAFPRVKKLPLETKRNILSAITHFWNVKGVTEEDRKVAYKKIIKCAQQFEICTIVFIDKYTKHVSSINS